MDSCASLVGSGMSSRSPSGCHALRLVLRHLQPARFVGEDGGQRADAGGVAGQQPVPQLLQEPAQHPLPGPDEQHPGVVHVRAGGGGGVGVAQHRVVAEPAQRPREELPPVLLRPDVQVELPAGAGQGQQLTQVTLVEAGQRVGLQPGRPLRHDPDDDRSASNSTATGVTTSGYCTRWPATSVRMTPCPQTSS